MCKVYFVYQKYANCEGITVCLINEEAATVWNSFFLALSYKASFVLSVNRVGTTGHAVKVYAMNGQSIYVSNCVVSCEFNLFTFNWKVHWTAAPIF